MLLINRYGCWNFILRRFRAVIDAFRLWSELRKRHTRGAGLSYNFMLYQQVKMKIAVDGTVFQGAGAGVPKLPDASMKMPRN
jgi:hypothetical protein